MKKYIFGEKLYSHIIDLTQTVEFIKTALTQVHNVKRWKIIDCFNKKTGVRTNE